MIDLAVLAGVIAATAALSWWWRARDGALRPADGVVTAELRARLGVPAAAHLLLEFTAPGCVPCRHARRVLDEVAGERDDVVVAELDVAADPQLAREHGVLRAPTVLVVGADGNVRARVGGVPDADELRMALEGAPTSAHAGQ